MSHQYHDWLLGEDSALRAFLPATITARSPRAVEGGAVKSPLVSTAPPSPPTKEPQ